MSATASLTSALKERVLLLEDDLRARLDVDTETAPRWRAEHAEALRRGRTASAWQAFRDDRVTQAAVAWVLATVFVRFCEDNALVRPVWIAGPVARRQEALDAELAFYRERSRDSDVTAREWLLEAVLHLRALPATRSLVDEHAPLWQVAPSGDAANALLAFWRQRDDDGALVHDLTDPALDTRFLGDLYQDLSAYAKATFALLQTPEFVEEFILDRTLEPALAERPLEGFRMIDPTCGSGHFLLGAFARLLDRWDRAAPGLEVQARVQLALDGVNGVDLNPFAVAIARFRLTAAALQASGLRTLTDAPAFRLHLVVGDSLLHGSGQGELDIGVASTDEGLSGFTYATEDLAQLREVLSSGRYDAVVGNPPYITVKDKVLNEAYRGRYKTCKGKYALTVPFMERFFDLARSGERAGWVGQITSNSFMKREFGSKLIEEFLLKQDLRLVADSSGAYVPGHGTPTVILVGRRAAPVGETVRAVLGVRGEPGTPDDPSKGIVWSSIVEHVEEPGWDDGWVTVADLPRALLASHPWSLTGGGAKELMQRLDAGRPLSTRAHTAIQSVSGDDDVLLLSLPVARWRDAEAAEAVAFGESIRDWQSRPVSRVIAPAGVERSDRLWAWRTSLRSGVFFGATREARGKAWSDFAHLRDDLPASAQLIAWAEVASHNHFGRNDVATLCGQTAPVIKLPEGATKDEHLALLGVLNSSTACFWLKQVCFNKGGDPMGTEGARISKNQWEDRFAFNGTNVAECPLPSVLPLALGRLLDTLAQDLARQSPEALAARGVPTADALAAAREDYVRLLARMVAVQEELDWEVYRLYGLIEGDLTYTGDDLPGLALGERAFEVALARKVAVGEETTAWFTRHGSTPLTELPATWPSAYRDLVRRRLDLMATDLGLRLLEKPEQKRRWSSVPWDKQQESALRGWLLDRLEDRSYWFDRQGRPAPRSVAQLADDVAREADLVSVLALWEGRPDLPVVRSLERLLADEAVPYLAAHRYKDTGLRKREAWEQTWALQRREDAGEVLAEPIPVPPKYTSADFRKLSYWQARGKLDVPKERLVLYPGAGRQTDPTPLIGWAGWNHAEQFLALSTVVGAREADGWSDETLVPLVGGLAELMPWVEQWHSGMDAELGVDLAQFCREELTARAAQVGQTTAQLADWRPAPATRGRKRKGT